MASPDDPARPADRDPAPQHVPRREPGRATAAETAAETVESAAESAGEPGLAGVTPPEPVIGPSPGDPAATAEAQGRPAGRTTPTLLEQMGGVGGMVASVIPVVVFIAVNQFFGLNAGIVAALAGAVAIGVWRLVRKEGVQPAVSGALGVAVCAFIAWRVGEARGFFLYGIWASLVFAAAFAVSLVVRWPLVGVLWHGVRGDGQSWRRDPAVVRAYDVATVVWTVVFAARFVVQRWLYDQEDTGALGIARLAMGLPLTALAALVTIWAARRAARSPVLRAARPDG